MAVLTHSGPADPALAATSTAERLFCFKISKHPTLRAIRQYVTFSSAKCLGGSKPRCVTLLVHCVNMNGG
jgi:hypothetical protein